MDWGGFAIALGTLGLVYGLLAIGLNIQFGYAGVLNFGYVAFFAVGAFASAWVTLPSPGSEAYLAAGGRYQVGFGLPMPVGVAAAAGLAATLAALIGAASQRLAAHYLAVTTFALAQIVHTVLGNEVWLTRGDFGISTVPQPLKGTWVADAAYPLAYLGLTALLVALATAFAMRATGAGFGRLLRAVRDDEIAARALGKRPGAARTKALVLGGALAGIAGSLWTHMLGVIHVDQFVPVITFQIWLAMLLGGAGNHWGVLIGTVVMLALREGTRFLGDLPGLAEFAAAHPQVLPSLRFVVIGALLILVVRVAPRGLMPEPRRRAPRAGGAESGLAAVRGAPPLTPIDGVQGAPPGGGCRGAKPPDDGGVSPQTVAARAPPPALAIHDVHKSFGGLTAVAGATFTVAPGTITGLIGPNGAGKSTLIDLVAGTRRPDAGRISLFGTEITGWPAHRIARVGLGRSFQTPRPFGRLTVWESLMVAGSDDRAESVAAALGRGRGRRAADAEVSARAQAVAALVGLGERIDARAETLSGGQRKLLGLGGLLMTTPRLMLLDEPAAGVNRALAEELFALIGRLNAAGLTFVIVEHDLGLILRWCHRVIVMHQGRVLASGTPAEIRRDPAVIDAYLGGRAGAAS